MPQGSHKPGRGQPCPSCVGEGGSSPPGEDQRGGSDEPCWLVQSVRLPPAGMGWERFKGDDDHHTCVITSAIGLAYQTLTGPSISIFKPFPPPKKNTLLPDSCSAVLKYSVYIRTSLPAVILGGEAGPCKQGFLGCDASLQAGERRSDSRISDCQAKGSCKLE